jgi:cytochrome-b5 reductase
LNTISSFLGITPMIQALHAILGEESPTIKVTMLYGSRTSDDILGKQILDEWEKKFPNNLKVIHVLSNEAADSDWTGSRGFISKDMIEQHFPSSASAEPFNIFICGPPPMYDFFSGPRTEKEVTGILGAMGYNADQVYKF